MVSLVSHSPPLPLLVRVLVMMPRRLMRTATSKQLTDCSTLRRVVLRLLRTLHLMHHRHQMHLLHQQHQRSLRH